MTTPSEPVAPGDTPAAIRSKFAAVAAATDTPPPGDGSRLPVLSTSGAASQIARELGMHLRPTSLFRFTGRIVTVDREGRIAAMTPDRFITWVENYVAFNGGSSMRKETASIILASDQFRDHIRELKGVATVRLPVWKTIEGKQTVELAAAGYDEEAGIFTINSVPYQDDLPVTDGFAFLLKMLQQFPFELEGETNVAKRRSFSAQIAAMVGVFVQALFPDGVTRPLVVYNANQSGSGKSLLMRMALSPVHGMMPEAGKPSSESELEKILDGAALARLPFLVLDDLTSLRSQALNRFATSPVHQTRVMHSQDFASIPKCTQLWATGNGLVLTADLDRRSLVVDLFEAGEVRGRSFDREITSDWLSKDEVRARFLAALWSLVRTWRDNGMSMLEEHRLASFERWSAVVGGIVTTCRLSNPFRPRTTETGGDESTRALNRVLGDLVAELDQPGSGQPDHKLTTDEILTRAQELGLIDDITGFAKDPRKSLGWRLKKMKGRHLLDSRPRDGRDETARSYEFGRRSEATGSVYPIRFLKR